MFIRKNRQRKNELVFPFRYQMNIQSLAWNSLTIIHQQKSISLKETSVISKLQSEFQLMERKSIHFSSSITGHNKRRIEILLIWLIKWNVWSFFIINKLYNWITFVILTIPRLIFLCVSALKIDFEVFWDKWKWKALNPTNLILEHSENSRDGVQSHTLPIVFNKSASKGYKKS